MDMRDENVSANVLIGHFGAESALLADAAERENAFLIAGSENLTAQALFYAGAREALIGEELFASGAYADSLPIHKSSLAVQDILRWIIIGSIILGAILIMTGLL